MMACLKVKLIHVESAAESRAKSVLCVQCGDWVHGRKGSVKGDSKVLRKLCMQKM